MSDITIHNAPSVEAGPPTKKLSCLEAMKEQRGEVVCFTPALLITHGQMPVDPLNEFVSRFNVPKEGHPFCVEVYPPTFPFFADIGATVQNGEVIDWDRRLYAVPKAYADLCFNFLGGLGMTGDNFFASAVTYEMEIPDPTMPQFTGTHNTIPIIVVGILSQTTLTYLQPNGAMPPFVKTVPASIARQYDHKFKSGLAPDDLAKIRGEL